MIFKKINIENIYFKPFVKGARLKNKIYKSVNYIDKTIFIIFSTSKCKTIRLCILKIDNTKTSPKDIYKLENLLSLYTWNLSTGTLKTTENRISYTLKQLVKKYNITVTYKSSIIKDNKKIKQILFNIILLKPSLKITY